MPALAIQEQKTAQPPASSEQPLGVQGQQGDPSMGSADTQDNDDNAAGMASVCVCACVRVCGCTREEINVAPPVFSALHIRARIHP